MVLRHLTSSFCPIDCYATDKSLKKDDDLIGAPKNLSAYFATLMVDFLFILIPMTLFFTILADWAYIGSFLGFMLFFATAAAKRIFPRENAKTETYGTGLMDLGVGSFVFANAIVSRQARNIQSIVYEEMMFSPGICFLEYEITSAFLHSMYVSMNICAVKVRDIDIGHRNWKSALKSTGPLILLGFGRIVSTTGVDYQVHVGEYGVHWNFFFTLAAVSILTSIINIRPKYCGILGSVILIGYWGLYLVGVQLGHYIFFGNNSQSASRSNKAAFIKTWLLGILTGLLTLLLDRHIERVSRRMCNLAYVTWIASLNLQAHVLVLAGIAWDMMVFCQDPCCLSAAQGCCTKYSSRDNLLPLTSR
ncbi:GWT1 family protein expressed [Citrus sinensis]|nr:GWT1 family protein expressed [Citrus sinensis]